MPKPERIQLSRAKGWKMPANTVKVDRTTKLGNPFKVTEDRPAADAVMAFRFWLTVDSCTAISDRKAHILAALPGLRGKNLACWCKSGTRCHADVLLELANAAGVRDTSADQKGGA